MNAIFFLCLAAVSYTQSEERDVVSLLRATYPEKGTIAATYALQSSSAFGALSAGLDFGSDAFFQFGGGQFVGRDVLGQSYSEDTPADYPRKVDWYNEPSASGVVGFTLPVVIQRDIVVRKRQLINVESLKNGNARFQVLYMRGQLGYNAKIDPDPSSATLMPVSMEVDAFGRIVKYFDDSGNVAYEFDYEAPVAGKVSTPIRINSQGNLYQRISESTPTDPKSFDSTQVRQHIAAVRADQEQVMRMVDAETKKPPGVKTSIEKIQKDQNQHTNRAWWFVLAAGLAGLVVFLLMYRKGRAA